MYSDQMGKDGISEPMIQALYYDFVARPGCMVYVMMHRTRYDAPQVIFNLFTR